MTKLSTPGTGVLIGLIAWPALVGAQDLPAERNLLQTSRVEVFIGVHRWDSLSELTTAAPGSFDSTGFPDIGGSFHWRMRERDDLLIGLDVAAVSSQSDIHYIREDLVARVFYVTPSIKWLFHSADGARSALDLGVGYYQADIADVVVSSSGTGDSIDVWENARFGAYIGASMDFPTQKSGGRRGFSVSARIHSFDFGNVHDEGVVAPGPLGDAGTLSGPMIMLQFGYHWNLKSDRQ